MELFTMKYIYLIFFLIISNYSLAANLKVSGDSKSGYYYIYESNGRDLIDDKKINKFITLDAGSYVIAYGQMRRNIILLKDEFLEIKLGKIKVNGIGQDTYSVYEKNGNYVNGTYTSESILVFAGEYYITLNKTQQNVTVVAGEESIINAGSLVVEAQGIDYYAVYDEFHAKNLIYVINTNEKVELFPANYTIELHNDTRKATVTANSQTTVKTGLLEIDGYGVDEYKIYDEFGRNYKYVSENTNEKTELFAGTYTIELHDTNKQFVIENDKITTISTSLLQVNGKSLDSYYVYDEIDNEEYYNYKSYRTTDNNIELLPQKYLVKLNGSSQMVNMQPKQTTTLETGVLRVSDSEQKYTLYNSNRTELKDDIIANNEIELFSGKYLVDINGNEKTFTIDGNNDNVNNNTTVTDNTIITPTNSENNNKTYTEGINAGIEKCKLNPADCGIIITKNDDGSTQYGIDKCKQNPIDCGISTSQNDDGSIQDGIDKCKQNPTACGISISKNDDGSIQDGIDKCKQNPADCGIDLQKNYASYNPKTGEVYIPFIKVPDAFNNIHLYEIYMIQQTETFIFDLDLTRVNLR
jgi:hypothetical protein